MASGVPQRSIRCIQANARVPLLFPEAVPVVHPCCQKFLRNVHNLFTCTLVSASPAGLRLEIAFKIDKKKMNFIFRCEQKIFLTRKRKTRVRGKTKKVPAADFVADFFLRRAHPLRGSDRSGCIAATPLLI